MQKYKMALQKITLSFVGLLMIVGCIKPQKKSAADLEAEGADNSATFYAKEISGKALAGKVGTTWNIPVSTQFDLQVCLSDKRTQDDIRLNKFVILGGEKDIHVRSDNNGCINWKESIAFELLSQPAYVQITRSIKSEGLQTGKRVLKIALNPWGSLQGFSGEPVIDLTKRDIPDGQLVSGDDATNTLKGMDTKGNMIKRSLNISSLNISNIDMNQGGTGRSIRTQVTVKPFFLINLTNRDTLNWKMTAGEANIEAEWVENVQGHKTILAHAKTSEPVALNDNFSFSTSFPMQIKKISSEGTIEFALRITPVDGPKNLGAYEGIFNIGDPSTFIGSHSPDPESNLSVADSKNFSVSAYLGDDKGGDTSPAPMADVNQYVIDHVKANDVHLIQNSTNGKTIGLTVATCLRDSLTLAPRQSVQLQVKGIDEKTHALQTDGTGCFSWNETIAYNPYEADHAYNKTISITGAHGFTANLGVRVDPWVYEAHQPNQVVVDLLDLGQSSGSGTGSDSAQANAQATTQTNMSGAQVKLNGYTLIEQGRYYYSDKHLLLRSTQKITMDLDASILMPADRITQQRSAVPLNDGIYYVRMAVRLPPLGPLVNEDIGWSEQLARAEGGRLKSINFSFDVSDIRAYGSRSALYVEISPVDQTKIGSMSLAQAVAKYTNPSQVLPASKAWAPRLFVASYVAGNGQQMTTFQALDDLLNGAAMDGSSSNVTNSTLSKVGGEVVADDFFTFAKQYPRFDLLVAQSARLQQQRLQNVLNLEKVDQMKQDLNAYVFDASNAQAKAKLVNSGLDKVNVEDIFHHQKVTRADIDALCTAWGRNVVPKAVGDLHLPVRNNSDSVIGICKGMLSQMISIDWLNLKVGMHAQLPFVIETRMQLIDALPTVQVLGNSQQMTLMVGNAFNATYTKAFTGTWNMATEAGAGVGAPLGFINAEAGAKVSAVRSDSSTVSVSNAQIVTAMSPLTVTKQVLQLQVQTYRPCVVVSTSAAFGKLALNNLDLFGLNKDQVLNVLSKKLMLCNPPTKAPAGKVVSIKENYYIVSSPVIDGRVEDGAAQDSHVWGQVIRGDADFANFLAMAQISDQRGDVNQSLKMAIPAFIQDHATLAMGHPGYYIMPNFSQKLTR